MLQTYVTSCNGGVRHFLGIRGDGCHNHAGGDFVENGDGYVFSALPQDFVRYYPDGHPHAVQCVSCKKIVYHGYRSLRCCKRHDIRGSEAHLNSGECFTEDYLRVVHDPLTCSFIVKKGNPTTMSDTNVTPTAPRALVGQEAHVPMTITALSCGAGGEWKYTGLNASGYEQNLKDADIKSVTKVAVPASIAAIRKAVKKLYDESATSTRGAYKKVLDLLPGAKGDDDEG